MAARVMDIAAGRPLVMQVLRDRPIGGFCVIAGQFVETAAIPAECEPELVSVLPSEPGE